MDDSINDDMNAESKDSVIKDEGDENWELRFLRPTTACAGGSTRGLRLSSPLAYSIQKREQNHVVLKYGETKFKISVSTLQRLYSYSSNAGSSITGSFPPRKDRRRIGPSGGHFLNEPTGSMVDLANTVNLLCDIGIEDNNEGAKK